MNTLLSRCAMMSVWCCAGVVLAQGNPLANSRLEVRIVPQTGLPGAAGGVVDMAGTAHTPVMLADADRTRRFEIQYRVTGLPIGMEFDGLQLASFDVTAAVVGGSTGVTLGRALLSRDESGGAGAPGVDVPPGTVDTSPASGNGSRGLHRPFRGIIPAPAPNNDYSANGILRPGGRLIDDVTPVTFAGSGQSAVDAQGNLRWYGLYSFDAVLGVGGSDQDGDGFVEVTVDTQLFVSNDTIIWYGFVAGDPRGYGSSMAANGHATVRVQVPGVGTLGGLAVGMGLRAGGRRRREGHAAAARDVLFRR